MDPGRILEFVKEEMLVADTCLFVDERSVGPVDDVPQKGVGVVEAQYVLLLEKAVEFLVQFPGYPHLVEVLGNLLRSESHPEGVAEHRHIVAEQGHQDALQARETFPVSLPEPQAEIVHPFQQRF